MADGRTNPNKKKPNSSSQAAQAVGTAVAVEAIKDAMIGGAATTGAAAGGAAAGGAAGGTSGMGASTVAGSPAYMGPAAGAAAGGAGLYNLGQNRQRVGTGNGMLQGAASGAALGASVGSVVPVIGTAIGGVVGGLGGLAYGAIGGKSRTENEDDRRGALINQGVKLYDFGKNGGEEKYNATVREDLAPDFVGFDKDGNWVNNKFATTRDESSLTGRDIDKYAAFSEIFGNDWQNASEENRWKIGDEAVKRGLLREHHGTLDVNADQSFADFAKGLLTTPAVAKAKERTVLADKPKRKKERGSKINWEEITPIGGNKPTKFAYTPDSQAPRSIQDYIDAITGGR